MNSKTILGGFLALLIALAITAILISSRRSSTPPGVESPTTPAIPALRETPVASSPDLPTPSRHTSDNRETPTSEILPASDPSKAPPNPLRPILASLLSEIAQESDLTRKTALAESAFVRVGETNLAHALAVLTDPEFAINGQEVRSRLLQRWGALDPQAASAWASRMSPGENRAAAYAEIARGWAGQNPDAASAWARTLSEPSERDAALIEVAYELARSKPVEALDLAIELSPTTRRDEVLNFSATQWASLKPQDALDWAKQVPDENLRARLIRDITTEWGDTDPNAAATAAVQSIPTGRAQNDAVVGIIQRWAQSSPEVAAAWIQAFPEGELRETAGRELVNVWADQAPEAAGHWLNALPQGSFRDIAVESYVTSILPAAPDTAATWAMEIRDPNRRSESLERVASLWLEVDAPAAKAWIPQSALAPETKNRLLQGNPKP